MTFPIQQKGRTRREPTLSSQNLSGLYLTLDFYPLSFKEADYILKEKTTSGSGSMSGVMRGFKGITLACRTSKTV